MGHLVKAPALRLGLFLCPLRFDSDKGYTNIPLVAIV